MVDTVRTIADILLLYANNTSGDISPQDARDMIVSLEALSPTVPLASSVTTRSVGTGEFNMLGFYDCPAADSNLTQASTTQVHGTANSAYAAHAVVVAAAAGVTDGSDLVLTITGTSITDAGVRQAADSEILVPDCTASTTDLYYESLKKWIGQITYTLSSTGGTTFNYDFNYGFAAYEDNGNIDFDLDHFIFEWFAGANDSGFDIEIHHHKQTGWTYSAAAFVAGTGALYQLSTDYVTERNLVNGDYGRWKRTGLADEIAGSASEGLIVHITTTVNNSVQWCNGAVNIRPTPS